jgi:hypothetical protein
MDRKNTKKEKMVDVTLDLGELKPVIQKAAKARGVSVNEFICNAIESKIRRQESYAQEDSYVRHGGKHLMGKHTGYEVTSDGRYYPAPSWASQFELLFAERQAIYNLINAVVAQAQGQLTEVEKNIVRAKEHLVDDLGLDPTKPWVYYGGERGYLKERKAEEEKE